MTEENTRLVIQFSDEMVQRAQTWDINLTKEMFIRFSQYVSNTQNVTNDSDKIELTFEKNKCCLWKGAFSDCHGLKNGGFNTGSANQIPVHRLMFIFAKGIPPDLVNRKNPCPCGALNTKANVRGQPKTYGSCCRPQVRHVCMEITGENHGELCINPLHMILGKAEENQHDIRVHGTGKGGVFKGETAYQAKKSNAEIKLIWDEMCKKQKSLKQIAEEFNVSYTSVKDMNRGKAWNEITGLSKDIHNKKRIARDEKKYQQKIAKRKGEQVDDKELLKKPKLTDQNAQEIVNEYIKNNKIDKSQLAKQYNVSLTSICDVIQGRTFKIISRPYLKKD